MVAVISENILEEIRRIQTAAAYIEVLGLIPVILVLVLNAEAGRREHGRGPRLFAAYLIAFDVVPTLASLLIDLVMVSDGLKPRFWKRKW